MRSNDEQASGPIYLQVARTLKDEILSGVHPVGALLPTEASLCDRFAISRHTVREALRRLREENLVVSRQGAGTMVAPPHAADAHSHQVMSINDLVAFASDMPFAIQAMKIVTIDRKLAERTGLESGSEWLHVFGYRHSGAEGSRACWTEYFINRRFAAVGRLLQRHVGPIFALIEDLFGQSIAEVHQEIAATLIAPALAEGLGVEPGTAALEVRRAYRIADGTIAQYTINTHPAALFSHSMTMRRVRN